MKMDGTITAVHVGCGGRAKAWVKAVEEFPDVEIAGLVDIDIEKAKAVQKEYNLDSAVTGQTLSEVLDAVQADVVFDCTVPEAHAEITIDALNRGCHVLGEKPMADSMENAERMTEAARVNDRIYAVIKNRRYEERIIQYQETVRSGRIGEVTTINADFFKALPAPGFRAEMEHPLLWDMAIHSFDQARFISGKEPVSVYCHEWNPKGSWFKHEASAVAIFEMTDGAIFTYRGSWCAKGLPTPWACCWRTIGTDGTATWDGQDEVCGQNGYFTASGDYKVEDVTPAELKPLEHKGQAGVIREFVDCVNNGGTPQTVCTSNLKSFGMMVAAVQSAESGQKVSI